MDGESESKKLSFGYIYGVLKGGKLGTASISDFIFCLSVTHFALLFGFLTSLRILPHLYRNDSFFNFR